MNENELPQKLLEARQKEIDDFLRREVNNRIICGWQVIVRKEGKALASVDASIIKSSYARLNHPIVLYKDSSQELLDASEIAKIVVAEQVKLENYRVNVVLFCDTVSCLWLKNFYPEREAWRWFEDFEYPITNKKPFTCLQEKLNVRSIGDLLCFDRKEIAKVVGIGPSAMAELKELLDFYGLKWGAFKQRKRPVLTGVANIEFQVIVLD